MFSGSHCDARFFGAKKKNEKQQNFDTHHISHCINSYITHTTYFVGACMCAVLLIAGLRISALSQPPTAYLPKPVAILPPPPPPPPPHTHTHTHRDPTTPSVLIRRPSPLLPDAPHSLLPHSPLHPARAFWTFTVSSRAPSIRPPDQCKHRTPYPLHILHFPCPQLTPPLYLTHKTPPPIGGLVRFSTWGAQPRHPTDGSSPLTHQPINLHLPTP